MFRRGLDFFLYLRINEWLIWKGGSKYLLSSYCVYVGFGVFKEELEGFLFF